MNCNLSFYGYNFILIALTLTILSCDSENKSIKAVEESEQDIIPDPLIEKEFESYFQIDSTLTKEELSGMLTLSSGSDSLEISYLCNCEKNVVDNTLKIQITSIIPTKMDLEAGNLDDRFPILFNDVFPKKGQFKILTIHLRNNTVENIQLISKSTDDDYNGSDFEILDLSNYEIDISTFDYSIASNVFGRYRIEMPKPFGFITNDTIVMGMFICNNWRIITYEQIKAWDLDSWLNVLSHE